MAESIVLAKYEEFEAIKPETVLKIANTGLKLLHDRRINYDHHLCNKVLSYREIAGERPLRPNHVNYLINCMLRGTFHAEWVKLVVCQLDGETYRMNGQHTCLARLEMPERWKDAGQVSVMTYEARTMDAMRELYASIDRGAPRTKANVVNSYLDGTAQFDGVPQRMIRLLSEGLAFWLWESGHERVKHDGDELAYLMQHNHKTIVETIIAYAMNDPRLLSFDFLRRASVIAAMYETFSKVHIASVEFWDGVKTGVGFTTCDDPRLRLRNALTDAKLTASEVKSRSKSVNQETMYRWCVNAFNRWRRGEQTKTVASTKERQKAR